MEGLTTTKAPFIEKARANREVFIEQPYDLYSEENHVAWKRLYRGMREKWERFAHPQFLKGLKVLGLSCERIPRLEEVNRRLQPLTGFQARAVSGYVPSATFFESLEKRLFPTTVTIRPHDRLDYLPEPDIFHDVAGHVPLHTDPTFARVLVRLARLAGRVDEGGLEAVSRFFWFTVEFGLMRDGERICAYGSGLLSSAREIEHALLSPDVQRLPFDLEHVVKQNFEIDWMQPLLFVIDSFDELYRQIEKLEELVGD